MKTKATPESLAFAAKFGMKRQQYEAARLQAEHDRMIALASGIHTEELFQQVLKGVKPGHRQAVEDLLRPYTKIPKVTLT